MYFPKRYKKILERCIAGVLLMTLIFPLFPEKSKAAPVTTVLNYTQLILTEGTTWTVPADWNNASNTIEVIGGGGAGFTDVTGINGAGGGGGGGYSKVSNISLTPGASITYQVGIGGYGTSTGASPTVTGTDTFFGRLSGTAGTCVDVTIICAKGGFGATSTVGAGGGMTTTASGTTKWAGGNGGTGNTTGDTAGGGGGAGGPQADGKTGGAGGSGAGGGSGGGGGNGGTSSTVGSAGSGSVGGKGGDGNLGTGSGSAISAAAGGTGTTTGAGGGGGDSTLSGGHGAAGTNLGDGSVGTGGGGGGGASTAALGVGGHGGLYGAGGGGGRYAGKGAPGVIVITYGNRIATKSTYIVPDDWNDDNNTIETIGAGGAGFSAAQGSGTGGGGGGGYSKSVNQPLVPGATSTYAVGLGGRKTAAGVGAGLNGGDSYFCNSTANCASISGNAVLAGAKGGTGATSLTGATGGASSTGIAFGIGLLKTSGGAGGTGNGTGDSGGGGGGAAGTSTVGQVGGIGYTSASGGGGGGGGAGGCTGAVGGAGVAANGGAGGNGPQCTGSGALGANAAGANGGLNTGAGGGGGDSPYYGGVGSNHGTSTYGGGGGGGSGDNNRVASGTPIGGDGGYFGGGGGAGLIQGFGGNGGIIIVYEPLVITASSTGTQTASITNGTANNDMGADFTFISTGSSSVTSITLTEGGTIDASSHLDNIKLYYDLDASAPYDCASESLSSASSPDESQFGSTDTDGFSSANGTSVFTGSARVSATTTMCTYVILDVLSGASGGQTIELSIASASDFTTNRGTEVATTAIMPGATTIAANASPTVTVTQPDGTSDTIAQDASYNITYTLEDTDNVVTAEFFYDSNASGLDGVAITGPCATTAEGTGVTCAWDTTGVTPGAYYVYASTTDTINSPVTDYSSGVITINARPTLTVSQPDGTADTVTAGDNYSVTYTSADSDDTVTTAFYYDTNASGLDGVAITGACATAVEGTGVTCTWDTTGVTPGAYYVYGIMNDGVNASVNDYSSGQITINAGVAVPTVSTQVASSITATGATLNGTIVSDGGASSTVRGFAWGTTPTLVGGDTATTTENGTFGNGTFTNSSLTLTCNTTYYSRAYATNSEGTGFGAVSSSFVTSACKPTVTTQSASSVGSLTATLNGTIVSDGGASSTVRGFAWGTGATLLGGDTATTTEVGTFGNGTFSTTTLTFVGNTTYYSRAYAVNSAGTSSGAVSSGFLTLPDTPGTPTASVITATTLTINWSAPTGGATTYKIERCTGSGCSDFAEIATGVAALTYGQTSLSPSTVYRYRVRATNATGDGAYATSADITTSATATTELSAYRFFDAADSYTPGTALAIQNTPVTLTSPGDDFRMRLLVHFGTSDVAISERSFKLQYAVKSGTCDTSFTGESYFDATTTSPISYKDSTGVSDNNALGVASDITHGGDTIVNQTYEEANNFTNSQSSISSGQDGKWDLSLYDNGGTEGQSYCLRVVQSDGSVLSSYSQIPEVAIPVVAPSLDQLHYRWRNDNGSESSATYAENEDTTLSSGVFIGDRKRLRFVLSNTGSGPATDYNFKIEYATTACSLWSPIASYGSQNGEHFSMDTTGNSSNAAPTSNLAGLSDPAGPTFLAGLLQTSQNQTGNFSLPANRFTELEYSLKSTANVVTETTYCFRLTHAGSITNFVYSLLPRIVISPTTLRPSGGGGGNAGGEAPADPPGQQQSGGGGGDASGNAGGEAPADPPGQQQSGGGSGGGGDSE